MGLKLTHTRAPHVRGRPVAAVDLQSLYYTFRQCMVGIESTSDDDDQPLIGAAFHIGDGFLLTASHVVQGRRISGVVPPHLGSITEIYSVHGHPDPRVDLALISSDFSLDHYMSDQLTIVGASWPKVDAIPIGSHLDDWLGDELVLTDVLLMGYPPVPTSRHALLVAVRGEVNAVVDRYSTPHVHFVVSSVARGGFSGGPALMSNGVLLGVITESLERQSPVAEPGFAAVLSIEPIYNLLAAHGVAPRANRLNCYTFASEQERSSYAAVLSNDEMQQFEAYSWDPRRGVPASLGLPTPPLRQGSSLWQEPLQASSE